MIWLAASTHIDHVKCGRALDLVKQANLEPIRAADVVTNPALGRNWLVVKNWNERARYETKSHQKGKKLYTAISDDPNGVMQWIRSHW